MRYLEVLFRSKLRLLLLVLLLPAAATALNLDVQRSYEAYEVVWVDDPGTFNQTASAAVGYNNYLTPSMNAIQRISDIFGTQSFNNALADKLALDGTIKNGQQRAGLISSLNQLTVGPGGSGSSGSGSAPDHTLSIHYICSNPDLCLRVLSVVLDVYRAQYLDLKGRTAADERSTLLAQLNTAQADLKTATDALDKYIADLEKAYQAKVAEAKAKHQQPPQFEIGVDPTFTGLQHAVDKAQKAVDGDYAQLRTIDMLTQAATAISNEMYVVEGPKTVPGLYGLKGFRKDNLKTLGIIWATCLAMGAVYLVLMALMDRTVGDPQEIAKRLGKRIVTIPQF